MPDKKQFPQQHQDDQPGHQQEMTPQPQSTDRKYHPAGKMKGKKALITGGDSGIGRAIAVHYAMEGADVAIVYLDEHDDAKETQDMVETEGQRCELIAGDIKNPGFCEEAVARTVEALGGLDVLVNHAGEQFHRDPEFGILDVTPEALEHVFRTNFFSFVHFTRAALPHMREGSSIINTSSVTAYKGSPHLIDYACSNGAIVSFTRSLGKALAKKGVRVNAVAPGPVWTPLIPASFPEEEVEKFGGSYPMGRAAQPEEIAPTYVFLACDDSSFYTGQVFHPNGGQPVAS